MFGYFLQILNKYNLKFYKNLIDFIYQQNANGGIQNKRIVVYEVWLSHAGRTCCQC